MLIVVLWYIHAYCCIVVYTCLLLYCGIYMLIVVLWYIHVHILVSIVVCTGRVLYLLWYVLVGSCIYCGTYW